MSWCNICINCSKLVFHIESYGQQQKGHCKCLQFKYQSWSFELCRSILLYLLFIAVYYRIAVLTDVVFVRGWRKFSSLNLFLCLTVILLLFFSMFGKLNLYKENYLSLFPLFFFPEMQLMLSHWTKYWLFSHNNSSKTIESFYFWGPPPPPCYTCGIPGQKGFCLQKQKIAWMSYYAIKA